MYISWAAFYEGRSDSEYLNVIIPRILQDILFSEGIRPYDVSLTPSVEFGISRRATKDASSDICDRQNEFHLLFIHADGGGRNQQANIADRREAIVNAAVVKCDFDSKLAVYVSPIKEIEAWALADSDAVMAAFGVTKLLDNILPKTPKEAERVDDPKAVIERLARSVGRRRRGGSGNLVRIAQEQRLSQLRMSPSFQEMEKQLMRALKHIGCLQQD